MQHQNAFLVTLPHLNIEQFALKAYCSCTIFRLTPLHPFMIFNFHFHFVWTTIWAEHKNKFINTFNKVHFTCTRNIDINTNGKGSRIQPLKTRNKRMIIKCRMTMFGGFDDYSLIVSKGDRLEFRVFFAIKLIRARFRCDDHQKLPWLSIWFDNRADSVHKHTKLPQFSLIYWICECYGVLISLRCG